MDTRATAIIMGSCLGTGDTTGTAMQATARVIEQCADTGLDVLLVAPQAVLNARHKGCEAARWNVAALQPGSAQQLVSASLSAGVQMSATSSGWILIPADMVMLQPSTLPMLCTELKHHLIVHATHGNLPRLPVGFGQELFSELIHLGSDHALYRLMNRYPTHAVEVDDAGVLMHPWHLWHPSQITDLVSNTLVPTSPWDISRSRP